MHITFAASVPVLFMIIGLILMKWARMKEWADVGRLLFQAGAIAFAIACANQTVALLK
jgi:hypothetical protein